MSSRRGKRAATTLVAETVAEPVSDAAQVNGKPVKLDAKKTKVTKNAKPTEQNNIEANGDEIVSAASETKSKRAASKKTAKQTDQIEMNDENTAPVKSKRAAAAKKNAKQSEENDADKKDEATVNGAADNTEKPSVKGRKKKVEAAKADTAKVEAAKVEEPKALKGKSKKVEAQSSQEIEEVPTNKTEKKAVKAKAAKKENAPKEVAEKAPSKRGAKKDDSTEKPAEPEKPANRRGKKAADETKSVKQIEENSDEATAEENNEIDSPKKAKGKGKKAADRAKSTKTKQKDDDTADEDNEVAPAKGKGKKGADKAKSTASKSKEKEEEKQQNTADEGNTTAEENIAVDSPKGRKRKPANAIKSPAKKAKGKSDTDVVDGGFTSKASGSPKKRKADTKATADSTTSDNDELVTKRKKTSKAVAKEETAKGKLNPTTTDLSQINFQSDKKFSLKIVSWNVAGLRALIAKNGFDYFKYEEPDIICLQEIKCMEDTVPEEAKLQGYHPYWCSTEGGHGGVAILSKSMPYNVEKNIGNAEMDEEGRIITAEYSKFFLVCVYVPNAGRKLINLDRRLRWNELFEDHVKKLKAKKPVIIVGDLNVAHEEIDLANPKTNRKNAGFSDEERAGMTDLLQHGFVDTFRDLHPEEKNAYTFWTYMGGARQKNVGWRLDYSLVSENLKSKVVDSFMRPQILGSDHCPIVLLMNF